MKIDVDYEISDKHYGFKSKDDLAAVKLLTGEFADTEFTFGVISMADQENDDGSMSISFDYTVHESKEPITEDIRPKFEIVLGDVLNSILLHTLEASYKRHTNESRKENTETPTE
jgi:hypothetical protein